MSANSEWIYYLVTTNWLKIRYSGHDSGAERPSEQIMPKDTTRTARHFSGEIVSIKTHGRCPHRP
jgi:hypothetical protein